MRRREMCKNRIVSLSNETISSNYVATEVDKVACIPNHFNIDSLWRIYVLLMETSTIHQNWVLCTPGVHWLRMPNHAYHGNKCWDACLRMYCICLVLSSNTLVTTFHSIFCVNLKYSSNAWRLFTCIQSCFCYNEWLYTLVAFVQLQQVLLSC